MSPRPHVVIIGGGVSGLFIAIFLAEIGCQVTLIEKNTLGSGSTQRSAACFRDQFGVEETVLGLAWSKRYYARLHEEFRTPPGDRQRIQTESGYLFLYEQGEGDRAAAWDKAQTNADMQRFLGIDVQTLDPKEVTQRWPHIDPDMIAGATWGPTDGFLYPANIVAAAERRARELGVTILMNRKVMGAVTVGAAITKLRIRAPGGDPYEIACDIVVNATNAWAARVSETLGGSPLRITPLKRYLYMLGRPNGWSEEALLGLPMHIFGMTDDRGAYCRPENAGQLMLGWAHNAEPEPNFTDEDQDVIARGFSYGEGADSYPYRLLEQIFAFAPSLVGAESPLWQGKSAGYYGDTPDHNPIIGWDGDMNLLVAAGFSGHGIMHAPYTAHIVRGLVAERFAIPVVVGDEPILSKSIYRAFALERDYSRKEGAVI